MPPYTDIFGRLDWLTKKVKALLGKQPAYKVYSAIINQQGDGSDISITLENGQPVVKGVSYQIIGDSEGKWDFSNVGGPVWPNAYIFVATLDGIPNNYGGWALQYNASAPVVTVFENTISDYIYFGRNDVGSYVIKSNGFPVFPRSKTFILLGNSTDAIDATHLTNFKQVGDASIQLNVYDVTRQQYVDGKLINTPIEIRVYN